MSLGLTIKVERNTATPGVLALKERLGGAVIHQAIGAAMLDLVQTHFLRRNQEPNKLGGKKTGFWKQISDGTSVVATDTEATVTIPPPFRQKFYGGTILPVRAKGLTIPISPNSYGRTAREMRLSGQTRYIPLNRGNVIGLIVSTERKGVIGEALFLVVRKVTQAADPSALPPMDALQQAAERAVDENLRAFLN